LPGRGEHPVLLYQITCYEAREDEDFASIRRDPRFPT
jgi:hypothetical protein